MAGDAYSYASGRVSGLWVSLLSGRQWNQLLSAADADEVHRILTESWYGSLLQGGASLDDALKMAVGRAEDELTELSRDESLTRGILQRRDVRNARYIWKNLAKDGQGEVETERQGLIPVETLLASWSEPAVADDLPAPFRDSLFALKNMAGSEAVLLDRVLDRLAATIEKRNLGQLEEPLGGIPAVRIELGNFLTAARLATGEGGNALLAENLLTGGYHTPEDVEEAARTNSLPPLLGETRGFDGAASALQEGLETGSFLDYQRESDLMLMNLLEDAASRMFSPGPLAAYVMGREMEVSHLRLLAAGKAAGIDSRRLRARIPRG